MPYQVTLWACRTCHTQYASQTEAQRCELAGTGPLAFQVGDRVRSMAPHPGAFGMAARVHRIEFRPAPDAQHLPFYDLRFEHDPSIRLAVTAPTLVGIPEDAPQSLPREPEVCYTVERQPERPPSFWRRIRDLFFRRSQ